jgi:hypothetical protein
VGADNYADLAPRRHALTLSFLRELAIGGGSYAVLYAVAGVSAIVGAVTILPVKRVR